MLRVLLSAFLLWASAIIAKENITEDSVSFLNDTETAAVIRAIDSVCGDTWCSGDFNYSFETIICCPSECYLDLSFQERSFLAEISSDSLQSRRYRCQLQSFASRDDLLLTLTGIDGRQFPGFTDQLFDAVGECISELRVSAPTN